ncbi:MAG: FAD-dependent oxidoreductase [Eggerthellaceae bacterium]
MVVGSGPAGINAALTAAQRGHAVDLYEEGGASAGA